MSRRAVLIPHAVLLLLVALVLLVCGDAMAAVPLGEPARAIPLTGNQTYGVVYRAWNGHPRYAVVVLPADYVPGSAEALPCIIQPHARHATPAYTATIWQDLPTTRHFMVICPDSAGRRNPVNAWGVQGQIKDIMDMPDVVEASIPWAKVDRERLYVVGVSMGAQEALDTLARFPDRFAAAASYDGVSNLAARYYEMAMIGRHDDQDALRAEVGGTPAKVPFQYRIRSSQPFAATLARCRVPLAVTWSTKDEMVINQAKTQTGSLCRRLRALDPNVTLTETVTTARHGVRLRSDPQAALEFLAPGGVWRARASAPPAKWAYGSWIKTVDVWGYHFAAATKPAKLWQATVGPGRAVMDSPVAIAMSMPWPGSDPVTITLNGEAKDIVPANGQLRIPFPAGHSVATFTPLT